MPMSLTARKWFLLIPAILLLALAAVGAGCGEEEDGTGTDGEPTEEATQQPASPAADEETAEINMVQTIRFDKEELTIPAVEEVKIVVSNLDLGVTHSFAIYRSEEAARGGEESLFETDRCEGSCFATLKVELEAGDYYFQCNVHPSQMNGTLEAK